MSRKKLLTTIACLLFAAVSMTITVDQLITFKTASAFASGSDAEVRIPVLCYHSVTDTKTGDYVVSPADFEEQMAWLHEHGYRGINLRQFSALMKGETPNDGRNVMITFDDGYKDNFTNAYPILSKYGYIAVEFLVTNWVSAPGYMNWSEADELSRHGWDLMSHTRTHPYLPLHTSKGQTDEIAGSKAALEKHLSKPVQAIAYPYGLRSFETVNIVKDSGYVYGFTFDDGMTTSSQDPYLLKRLFISGEMDAAAFAGKMGMTAE
ncbi:polysaccharide deacetylase family protein [Paenibacillus montanisoli]|uniref:Polysaccharide deacetylase family protein n=1 Tax=Paenibacillus montanisoli TaxID=2081970 RepID=A0A328TYU3_9BACL|nr:polysaccharide deacetylase family protein [Paenibacillus montanisoli]RAP74673.1 polysaccharide deacetylase family protein [Paenibacillus montanisoli]